MDLKNYGYPDGLALLTRWQRGDFEAPALCLLGVCDAHCAVLYLDDALLVDAFDRGRGRTVTVLVVFQQVPIEYEPSVLPVPKYVPCGSHSADTASAHVRQSVRNVPHACAGCSERGRSAPCFVR